MIEAVLIGVVIGWLTTGFFEDALPERAWLARVCGGAMFGLQLALLPIAMRWLAGRSVIVTAMLLAAVATLGEWLQSHLMMGLVWSMGALCLPVGDTPLAQWAFYVTPFGVSALLYAVNFLWLPRRSPSGRLVWNGPLLAATLLGGAWIGGEAIAANVAVKPLPFSAMLVQLNQVPQEGQLWQPWIRLDELTRESLEEEGPVDLIVWPETCLAPCSVLEAESGLAGDESADSVVPDDPVTLQKLRSRNHQEYQTVCLVGVQLFKRVSVQRYGLEMSDIHRTNAACLIDRSGAVSTHEKLVLVPLMEGLPEVLDTPWFRRNVLPYFQMDAHLKPGDDFRVMEFQTEEGRQVRIAASICYESHFPWLPQYDPMHQVDAVVHIVNDARFSQHPEWAERQLLACRYRAIESRSWNLICSTWDGSAIIDPRRRVVARLPAKPGVLRSDTIADDVLTSISH